MLRRVLPFVTVVAAAALGILMPGTQAQAQSSTFANASVQPKFAPDPMQLRGVIGGTAAARNIAGTADTETGACLGFMAPKPYHQLALQSRFRYLSIVAASSTDTTILIKGPGGTWCNDDYDGKNAGISGEWLPGVYNIWVGSYSTNKAVPYVLRISETR